MAMAAFKSFGSAIKTLPMASMPPREAPIRITSRRSATPEASDISAGCSVTWNLISSIAWVRAISLGTFAHSRK